MLKRDVGINKEIVEISKRGVCITGKIGCEEGAIMLYKKGVLLNYRYYNHYSSIGSKRLHYSFGFRID